MSTQDYLSDPKVKEFLDKAEVIKKDVVSGKRFFSDILDENGHQYVDLVQQGGGVLGAALVGYTMVLEKAGLRFFNIAGASAGGINSMVMAASGSPDEVRSDKVLDVLQRKDLSEIVDGPAPVPSVVDYWIRGGGLGTINWGEIIWDPKDSFQAIFGGITDKFGVNPGDNFHAWMKEELGSVNTLQGLRDRMAERGARITHNGSPVEEDPRIGLITAELNTKSKVEFPKMADLFWEKPEEVHPADFVRATMSVPMFFEPFEVTGIPGAGQESEAWEDRLWHKGKVPEKAMFVDGGMVSNFPIDIFHREDGGTPRKPTFGARLTSFRESLEPVKDLSDYTGALLHTMRHDFDVQYLQEHEELQHLICNIDAGEVANWLNFYMGEEQKKELFKVGAERGLKFLEGFDWERYKEKRRTQSE